MTDDIFARRNRAELAEAQEQAARWNVSDLERKIDNLRSNITAHRRNAAAAADMGDEWLAMSEGSLVPMLERSERIMMLALELRRDLEGVS